MAPAPQTHTHHTPTSPLRFCLLLRLAQRSHVSSDDPIIIIIALGAQHCLQVWVLSGCRLPLCQWRQAPGATRNWWLHSHCDSYDSPNGNGNQTSIRQNIIHECDDTGHFLQHTPHRTPLWTKPHTHTHSLSLSGGMTVDTLSLSTIRYALWRVQNYIYTYIICV